MTLRSTLLKSATRIRYVAHKTITGSRVSLGVFLILSQAIPTANAESITTLPNRFDAYYAISKGPITFGKTRRSVKTVEGKQIFESITEPTGIATLFASGEIIERSTWDMHDGSPRPLEFVYQNTSDESERKVKLKFDWDTKEVTNIINGDPWKQPLEPGTMDKLLYQLAIMSDLAKGKTKLAYPIADGGLVKVYNIDYKGIEEIKTELGRFKAIKLVREEEKRRTTIWCAPELAYLPVRIEQVKNNGMTLDAVLYSIENMPGVKLPTKK